MKYFILLLFLIFSTSILSANSDIKELNYQLIGKNYQENELQREKTQYYLTDQVDSVKVVIFEKPYEKPIVANRFEYLPYGESWITEGEGVNNPKYNSQELDKETSFYFYNARHYDPEIARFVTADNVVDGELSSVGWNRYAYVKGNPVVYKDPTGNYLCGTGKSESCIEAYEPETTKRSITLEQAKENLESRKFVLNNLDNPGVGIGMALTGSGKSSEQYEASAKKGAALWNVFAGFSGAIAKGISKLTNLNKKGNNTVKNVTQGSTGGGVSGTQKPVKVNNVKAKSTDTGEFADYMTPKEAKRYKEYWKNQKNPEYSEGYSIWKKYLKSGDLKDVTTYDKFGRKKTQFHFKDSRGRSEHRHDYWDYKEKPGGKRDSYKKKEHRSLDDLKYFDK